MVWLRFIAFSTRSDPDCSGMCSCGITLGVSAIASPPWDEQLEFLSIKVQDGPLTSRLQAIQPGDQLYMGKKPTGGPNNVIMDGGTATPSAGSLVTLQPCASGSVTMR